ncbi:MAG: 3-oxoacid CoA-transferase subunit A [Betaproteobacteria bacterium]|nr:3-oxoacid CoA-transferase subunit A [Betaproteobacteria bacterium]MBI3936231.1 3-oxoacid CoA-transferase subunit A [Betaproteobacteria bacterium]
MDKVFASPQQAIADIPDGATIAIAGFGVVHRFATSLIIALRDKGTKDLCLVCNSLGDPGATRGQILAENKQVRKLIAAFSMRPGTPTASEAQIAAGEMEVELVPQGILVERCRAGGAGIPAFYSPTTVGTAIAAGKEVREFNGKPHVLEHAIRVDYAFLRGYRADRLGNVQFRGGSQNFNPSFAKAARVAIVEVDETVEPGGIPPELVNLPGIFVSRVVKTTQTGDPRAWRRPERRPSDKPRLYNGKPALTRAGIAKNAARLVRDGTYVNLGTGIPTLVSNYLHGRDVILHAENGVLGYGEMVAGDQVDPDIYNAAGQYVSLRPGASFFDSVTSFEMARGGRIDTVILGAFEVDQHGSVANWSTTNAKRGAIGGAMDLLSGKGELIIVMEHTDSKGRPKLRCECTYPLTGKACVNYVVTDLALLHWHDGRFVLDEVAPGFTPQEVIALGDMEIAVTPDVRTME